MSPELEVPFGSCELCGDEEIKTINILPIEKADGSLITLACTPCAEETNAFCKEHSSIHIGFGDNTSACVNCIKDVIDKDALQIYESFSKSLQGTPKEFEVLNKLNEWANVSSQITGDPEWISIVRSIVTVSERKSLSFEEVIEKTIENGSDFLLN